MNIYIIATRLIIICFVFSLISFCASAQPDPPVNDSCAYGIIIDNPIGLYSEFGTTIDATLDCPGLLDWNAVWFKIMPPFYTSELTIDICGSESLTSAGNVVMLNCLCDGNFMMTADSSGFYIDNTCFRMKFYGINTLDSVF